MVEVILGVSIKFWETPAWGEEGEHEEPVNETKREGSEWWENQENEVLEARRGESGQESKQVFH